MSIHSSEIRSITLLGTRHALPYGHITSAALDQQLNLRAGTIERVGGVRMRYFATHYENAAVLAAKAGNLTGTRWKAVQSLAMVLQLQYTVPAHHIAGLRDFSNSCRGAKFCST